MNTKPKYGLIVPNKKSAFQTKKSSILKPRLAAFNNEDDSSDEDGQKHVNSQIHKEAMKKIVKKQTKLELQKALEQDATVFEYDSIYDDMKTKAKRDTTPKNVQTADKQKKPKYIGSLMKAAERRNLERQRVEERKIEKERKQEGDQFSDKPQFVTSAYKKRMEEREKEEEEERRMAALEDAMDVRKQKDLSGFYKHLLRRQVGEEALPGERPDPSNEEQPPVENEEDRDTDLSFSSSSDDDETPERSMKVKKEPSSSIDSNSSSSSSDEVDHEVESRSHSNQQRNDRRNYDRNYSRDKRDRDHKSMKHSRDRDDRDSIHKRRDRDDYDRDRDRGSNRSRRDRDYDRTRTNRTHEKNDRERHSSHDDHKKREYRDDDRKKRSDRSPERKRTKETPKPCGHDDSLPTRIEKSKESIDETSDQSVPNAPEADKNQSGKFKKRTDSESAMAARERYLARKKAGPAKRAPVEPDSD